MNESFDLSKNLPQRDACTHVTPVFCITTSCFTYIHSIVNRDDYDCNAVYAGETGRSVRTRNQEHVDVLKTFGTKKSALSQHIMDFDHKTDWENVKILKSQQKWECLKVFTRSTQFLKRLRKFTKKS